MPRRCGKESAALDHGCRLAEPAACRTEFTTDKGRMIDASMTGTGRRANQQRTPEVRGSREQKELFQRGAGADVDGFRDCRRSRGGDARDWRLQAIRLAAEESRRTISERLHGGTSKSSEIECWRITVHNIIFPVPSADPGA